MAEAVKRAELNHVLSEWGAGRMTAEAVHDWAAERYAISGFEPEDDVVNEVLARLDMLDANLTTADDAQALQRLLSSGPQGLPDALRLYEAYLESLDFEERKRTLANEPMYAPFCR